MGDKEKVSFWSALSEIFNNPNVKNSDELGRSKNDQRTLHRRQLNGGQNSRNGCHFQ